LRETDGGPSRQGLELPREGRIVSVKLWELPRGIGLFGMLMALLNYSARTPSGNPATGVAPEQQHGKAHKKH